MLEMKLQSCKTPHKLLSPFVASYLWMVQNVFPAVDKNSSKKNTCQKMEEQSNHVSGKPRQNLKKE
jgi:hypothetical protein